MPHWKAGDKVILNGWGLGETHLGAYAEKARVKGDWLVRLPPSMSDARGHGDRHRRLYRDAVGDGAGEAWPYARRAARLSSPARPAASARLRVASRASLAITVNAVDRAARRRRIISKSLGAAEIVERADADRAGPAAGQGALGRRHRLASARRRSPTCCR